MNLKTSLTACGAILVFGPVAFAAGETAQVMDTQAYLAPLAESLKPVAKFSRWTRARDAFMRLSPADKDPAIGRGEAEFVFPFAIAGVELKKKGDDALGDKYIKAAMDTLKGFNKIGDNPAKFSVPKDMNGGSIGQIGFVLPAVASAAQVLYQNGYLKGEELDRTNKMLEAIADHWLANSPQVGMQGMSNWNNRHGLGPLRVANFLELQKKDDPETAKKIKAYRRYALAVLLRGADYPYGYKLLPDGKIAPAVKITGREAKETPAPADRTPRFGITENSSGYNSDSIYNFLNLVSEMPKSELPLDDKRMQELCDWVKGWQSLVAPDGAIPSYGDSSWDGGTGWIMVFEKAAVMFSDKSKYGDAAAGFKATALAINQYLQKHGSGVQNDSLGYALLASGYSGEAKRAPETSQIIERQNPGTCEMQPAVVILRGDDRNPAMTMFQTFHNHSHSHGDIGCLLVHSVNGKVMQHESGYDAGEMYFHQQVLIRPADEEFIPFAQVFKDPKKTIIAKGNKNLPHPGMHQYRNVSLKETPEYAYTQITTNYRTAFPKQNIRRVEFTVKRQAVLDKKSGALIVFDSVINDRNIKVPVAISPLWHVQNVLQKTADGFVCSDDHQAEFLRNKVKIGKPTGPFWIGMKGPDGFVPEQLTWKFIGRSSRNDITAKEHLYLKGGKTLDRNEAVGMVTVLMPLDKAEITQPPAQITVKNNTADVTLAGTRYTITPDGVNAAAAK